jgi:hypothetical protein
VRACDEKEMEARLGNERREMEVEAVETITRDYIIERTGVVSGNPKLHRQALRFAP